MAAYCSLFRHGHDPAHERLLLADDPTGNLDTKNGARIFELSSHAIGITARR